MIWIWVSAWGVTVAACALLRNRYYATFVAGLLGVLVLIWSRLYAEPSSLNMIVWGLSALVFIHYLLLVRARMRSLPYRLFISWPALWFVASTLLALPWALAEAVGFELPGAAAPFIVATVGLFQSLTHRPSTLDVVLDGSMAERLMRADRGEPTDERPLEIAHITDTHLGPFVSEARLRRAMERVAARQPDLVLLTGDFMTMESSGDPAFLERAFAPLAALEGRVFACRGNHDLEAPHVVEEAFEALGIRLLIDEAVDVSTPVGEVQILGIDYKFRGAAREVREVVDRHPRGDSKLRIVLLHHPGHFRYIPDGHGDLVLSGHTHGGQLGLIDLGINISMIRTFVRVPDHGFWAEGKNRLYVSRGFGHYGFPLRVGVRAEESLLRVHLAKHPRT